mgnify:CR=1 FL=1
MLDDVPVNLLRPDVLADVAEHELAGLLALELPRVEFTGGVHHARHQRSALPQLARNAGHDQLRVNMADPDGRGGDADDRAIVTAVQFDQLIGHSRLLKVAVVH